MITKITDSNRSKYSLLFEKANNALLNSGEYGVSFEETEDSTPVFDKTYYIQDDDGTVLGADSEKYTAVNNLTAFTAGTTYYEDPGAIIYDLNSYFQNLQTLANISNEYLKLPLDEPHFEILDSAADGRRIIKVPADFAKNGVSVMGDEVAEILFFKMDRFYESIDLVGPTKAQRQVNSSLRPINIVFQLELADGTKKVRNAILSNEGIPFIDADNNIYFGFALDSELTQTAGNIKFNVIFYRHNGTGGLDFSLNTQPATIKINSALAYQITNLDTFIVDNETLTSIDKNSDILSRVQNSTKFADDDVDSSSAPTFAEASNGINLLTEAEVAAYTSDQKVIVGEEDNQITYYKVDLNNGSSITKQGLAVSTNSMGAINYTWKSKQDINGSDTGSAAALTVNTDYNSLFVKATSDKRLAGRKYYKVENGKYVLATDLPDAGTVWREADKLDNECIYYERRSPQASISGVGCYWLVATNNEGKKLPTSVDSYRLYVPGPTNLTDSQLSLVSSAFLDDTSLSTTLTATTTDVIDGDTVSAVWNDNTTGLTKTITVDEEDMDLYDEDFTITVKASRNNSTESTGVSKTVRITAHPRAFIFNDGTVENHKVELTNSSLLASQTLSIEDSNKNDILSDKVLYRWFVANVQDGNTRDYSNDTAFDTLTADDEGVITYDNKLWKEADSIDDIEDITPAALNVNYYCKVVNYVNGEYSTPAYTNYTRYTTPESEEPV